MINIVLLILAVASSHSVFLLDDFIQGIKHTEVVKTSQLETSEPFTSLSEVNTLLHAAHDEPREPVIDKVIMALNCARRQDVTHNNILTIIDYSLPSNVKRLWVYDIKEKKLLFHTYVSHGIKSGTLLTTFFSNKFNSKASSIGVYKTDKAYYGREGLSLRLNGLDASFNDNASNRSVVMHGGWYVEEPFIKKYGRPGRSWGCPAVPPVVSKALINAIKDNSFFVIYYPSDGWFSKSRFLHCQNPQSTASIPKKSNELAVLPVEKEVREDILFADIHKNHRWGDSTPVLVMTADAYTRLFHKAAPLDRMLRRQINTVEYIALSTAELNALVLKSQGGLNTEFKEALNKLFFVVPEIIMVRGYYETQMKLVQLGTIKEVRIDAKGHPGQNYTVYFQSKPAIALKPTGQFIRWVGL